MPLKWTSPRMCSLTLYITKVVVPGQRSVGSGLVGLDSGVLVDAPFPEPVQHRIRGTGNELGGDLAGRAIPSPGHGCHTERTSVEQSLPPPVAHVALASADAGLVYFNVVTINLGDRIRPGEANGHFGC